MTTDTDMPLQMLQARGLAAARELVEVKEEVAELRRAVTGSELLYHEEATLP